VAGFIYVMILSYCSLSFLYKLFNLFHIFKQGYRFKKIILTIYLVVVTVLGIVMVIAVAAG
jgi:hypothetical protein